VFLINPNLTKAYRKQRTLKKPVTFSGIGVHTGKEVTMRFCPEKEGRGIYFKRVDLPHQPEIPAHVNYVLDTLRSTTIGSGNVRVHTVEHVMAALKAFDIDNLCIEVSNVEPPIGNGSSDVFVDMIKKASIEELESLIPVIKLQKPFFWSEGEIHLVAIPYDGFRISYTLNYPAPKILHAQFFSGLINSDTFSKEIAPCRTFSLYEEVEMLMDKGLIKGGSLDNAVIIKGEAVFSKGGLFFPDEMVRHKVLDVIGDLALVPYPFHAHIIAVRSGHASNHQLAKEIYRHITAED
jgi:UDP-3-O-[3-hydroxymyristoyl] N-acetylglucosamine deacetylase